MLMASMIFILKNVFITYLRFGFILLHVQIICVVVN